MPYISLFTFFLSFHFSFRFYFPNIFHERNIVVDLHFSRVFPLDGETRFFFFNYFFEKPFIKKRFLESPLILVFFLRENKIRNKNPSATPCLEKTCLRNRVQIRRSCYLLGRYDSEP